MTDMRRPGLLRVLDECEADAWRDLIAAAPPRTAEVLGLGASRLGGATALVADPRLLPRMGRVLGMGADRPAGLRELGAADRAFAGRGGSPSIQMNPLAERSGLPDLLAEHGYRPDGAWVKLVRETAAPPSAPPSLTVRRAHEGERDAWGRLAARALGWPRVAARWLAASVGRPRWHHYLAWEGGVPVAAAALFTWGGYAWLGLAGTLPEHRRRGAHAALLARRIGDAAALGCPYVVAEVDGGAEEGEGALHALLRAGFRQAYLRPSWTRDAAAAGARVKGAA